MKPLHAVSLCIAISVTAAPASAQDGTARETPLEELERKADDLSDTARRTVEEFVNLIGPIMMRLSLLIDDLPTYEMPEIMPNGDIIIRREREADPLLPGETDEDGLIKT